MQQERQSLVEINEEKLARMGNLRSSEIKQEIVSQNKFALGFEKLHNTNLEGWEKSEKKLFLFCVKKSP